MHLEETRFVSIAAFLISMPPREDALLVRRWFAAFLISNASS
jgi:hypothetical protein